jgi:heat shock protein 5
MARPPTRTQSRRLFSSLSVAFFILVAILCFTAPVKAVEEPHAEYGTVIGIGQ